MGIFLLKLSLLMKEELTRRDFLRGVALTATVLILPEAPHSTPIEQERMLLENLIRERKKFSPIVEPNILQTLNWVETSQVQGQQENEIKAIHQVEEALIGNEARYVIGTEIQRLRTKPGEQRVILESLNLLAKLLVNLVRQHHEEGMNLQAIRDLFTLKNVFEILPADPTKDFAVVTLVFPPLEGMGLQNMSLFFHPSYFRPDLSGDIEDRIQDIKLPDNLMSETDKPPYGFTFAVQVPHDRSYFSLWLYAGNNTGMTAGNEYVNLHRQDKNLWAVKSPSFNTFLPYEQCLAQEEQLLKMTSQILPLSR